MYVDENGPSAMDSVGVKAAATPLVFCWEKRIYKLPFPCHLLNDEM